MDEPAPHLEQAPPLDPVWIAYEASLPPAPPIVDIQTHKKRYILACNTRNAALLTIRDIHLTRNITISDIPFTDSESSRPQIYRQYVPTIPSSERVSVVYYHGGGLYVGDLDSEDLTCRRICIELGIRVFSCHYRTMPDNTPDDALFDATALFSHLNSEDKGPFVIVGSSSGGQLAAQVSQAWTQFTSPASLKGVLLRCPVTCNPSTPSSLPQKYQPLHTSLDEPSFHNSVITATCVDSQRRTFIAPLPLEADLEKVVRKLPRHWVQLCTNDLFYSDGACYVDLLKIGGVEVRTDLVVGWPHTFWLKHPECKCRFF